MGRKSRFSVEEKLCAVKFYLTNQKSISQIAEELSIDRKSFRQWVRNYEALGIDGISPSSQNQAYSKLLKEKAVMDYISGAGSIEDICKKYKIKGTHTLQSWLIKYNSHEELKSSGRGGTAIMTKGRKTTYEERIEIIQYCIEHKNNYAKAVEKYGVSYQQVYTWIKKYE